MKKKFVFGLMLTILCVCALPTNASDKQLKDITLSNEYFSIVLPHKVKGTYYADKKNNGIFIYEKESKKAGFGGFAFGIKAYKSPSDYAMMPGGRKIGELTDKNGNLYDIALIQPTDVQYDYNKGISEKYETLYKIGENATINGNKGSEYHKNQGMKGEDLYKEILDKHLKAINEKWDSAKLEQENMSYMYNAATRKDKIGYIYYDVNNDGIEELLIGEIAQGEWKGVIYDIYTMVNRKPTHVISGGSRDRYYICDDYFVCNEYSSGAGESGWLVYFLTENSTELFPQVGFKYDIYKDKNNPWFISYNFKNDKWENVSEQIFKERKATFSRYKKFDYIPLKNLDK